MNDRTTPTVTGRLGREAQEARYALRVAARLSERAEALPHELGERLRVARERALERARHAGPALPVGGGTLALGGGDGPGWGWRLAALAPGVALVAGLLLIQALRDDEQSRVAAEIDAALLADDLPPNAYADPGFAEFLRVPGR
jgi:hypothetical protein